MLLWSVLSAIHRADHNPYRLRHYKAYANTLNLKDLVFPITTKQIPTFEKNNDNISANVLYYDHDSGGFTIEYLSTERGREHHINLLLLDDENDLSKRHYTWIKNMSALVCHRTKRDHTHSTYAIRVSTHFKNKRHSTITCHTVIGMHLNR